MWEFVEEANTVPLDNEAIKTVSLWFGVFFLTEYAKKKEIVIESQRSPAAVNVEKKNKTPTW